LKTVSVSEMVGRTVTGLIDVEVRMALALRGSERTVLKT